MKEGCRDTATVRLSSCLEPSGAQATPRNARIDVEVAAHVLATMGPFAISCIATSPALVLAHSSLLRSGGAGPWIVINGVIVGEHGSTNQRHDIGLGSRNAFDSDHVHTAGDEERHLVADMETDQGSPQWR